MFAALLLIAIVGLLAGVAFYLKKRYPENNTPLVTAVDNLLPQTQCAQCGYPGCRPYAEAIVNESAALNLCPPGGEPVTQALQQLMGVSDVAPPERTHLQRAVIAEAECIGCTLCLPPCPVDAIVGAAGQMHTVLTNECTGCELCIEPCPVDCITMVDIEVPASRPDTVKQERACIHCGRCDPVCPVALPVEELLHAANDLNASLDDASAMGLDRCIDCHLCDRACPSNIPLADIFSAAKQEALMRIETANEKERLRIRYDGHLQRQQEQEQRRRDKRSARLAGTRDRSW